MTQSEDFERGAVTEALPDADIAVKEQFPSGLPENVIQACHLVMSVANSVLRKCTIFSLDALKEENPTIAEIALGMKLICAVLSEAAKEGSLEDALAAQKAWDYALHIHHIAIAIEKGDEAELTRQTDELTKRSFL